MIDMGFKTVDIKTITTSGKGDLSFFEARRDCPFSIKRIYFISGVGKGVRRGGHAHRALKQLLVCTNGEIEILLDDGGKRKAVVLDSPSKGLIIEGLIWRDMIWRKANSVLLVAASEYYDESDYIRDYETFRQALLEERK